RGRRHRLVPELCELAHDPVGAEVGEQVELGLTGSGRTSVGQVDDLPLVPALDGRMRSLDEAPEVLRQPVIAARQPGFAVHALLNHDPFSIVGDDEAMQVEVEAVLYRGAVHLGDQPAGSRESATVEADPLAD